MNRIAQPWSSRLSETSSRTWRATWMPSSTGVLPNATAASSCTSASSSMLRFPARSA